jgi:hypothetical protein
MNSAIASAANKLRKTAEVGCTSLARPIISITYGLFNACSDFNSSKQLYDCVSTGQLEMASHAAAGREQRTQTAGRAEEHMCSSQVWKERGRQGKPAGKSCGGQGDLVYEIAWKFARSTTAQSCGTRGNVQHVWPKLSMHVNCERYRSGSKSNDGDENIQS